MVCNPIYSPERCSWWANKTFTFLIHHKTTRWFFCKTVRWVRLNMLLTVLCCKYKMQARWKPTCGASVKWYSTVIYSEDIRTNVIKWPTPPTHLGQTRGCIALKGSFSGPKAMDHNKTSGSLLPSLCFLQATVEGLTFPQCEILAKILKDDNIVAAILQVTQCKNDKKAAKKKTAGYNLMGSANTAKHGLATYIRHDLQNIENNN